MASATTAVTAICLDVSAVRGFFRVCAELQVEQQQTSVLYRKADLGILGGVSSMGYFERNAGDPLLRQSMARSEMQRMVRGFFTHSSIGPYAVKSYLDAQAKEASAVLQNLRDMDFMARKSTRDYAMRVAWLNLGATSVKAVAESALAVSSLLVPAKKAGIADGIYLSEQLTVAVIEDWSQASRSSVAGLMVEEFVVDAVEKTIKAEFKKKVQKGYLKRLKIFCVAKDIGENILSVVDATKLVMETDATFR